MLYLFRFFSFCFFFRGHSGLLNSSYEGRIVSGYQVEISRYPHSVFLNFRNNNPKACGSSLITNQAIITAAHCLDELKYFNGEITAYFGSSVPQYSKLRRHVIAYRVHPKYDRGKGRYNLGIALLNERVPLDCNVQKIPIAVSYPTPNDILFTSGWGKQDVSIQVSLNEHICFFLLYQFLKYISA